MDPELIWQGGRQLRGLGLEGQKEIWPPDWSALMDADVWKWLFLGQFDAALKLPKAVSKAGNFYLQYPLQFGKLPCNYNFRSKHSGTMSFFVSKLKVNAMHASAMQPRRNRSQIDMNIPLTALRKCENSESHLMLLFSCNILYIKSKETPHEC